MPQTPQLAFRFDSLQQEAYLALWRTYDRLRTLEEELFDAFELTAQQYNLLRLLASSSPHLVPTLSLVRRLVSRAPDVTRMLEQRRLIVRERSEADRRAVLVGITKLGLARLKQIARPLKDCHLQQLGHLTSSDLRELVRLLRKARTPHEPPDSPWS